MADHIMEAHGGQKSEDPFEDFEFHQLRVFLKALERQVAESVYMEVAETRGVVKMGPVLQRVARELCKRRKRNSTSTPGAGNPRCCWGTEVGPLARWGHREEEGEGRGSSRGATQCSGKPPGLASLEGALKPLWLGREELWQGLSTLFLHHHLHLHPVTRRQGQFHFHLPLLSNFNPVSACYVSWTEEF